MLCYPCSPCLLYILLCSSFFTHYTSMFLLYSAHAPIVRPLLSGSMLASMDPAYNCCRLHGFAFNLTDLEKGRFCFSTFEMADAGRRWHRPGAAFSLPVIADCEHMRITYFSKH
ncbi:hypothetical protein AALO_G00216610 [Alosa alosa]|uniref:Secreted protein n=1 Tax=Alosa alosa TaxID=278164 RepID=A0AAV6G164_9TELE|nr:hypothetical protein AALO_G00216610 [Alosa alosa]